MGNQASFLEIAPLINSNIVRYDNGDYYEGSLLNNMKNGKGKLIYQNGTIYEGLFKDNLRQGYGYFTDKNKQITYSLWFQDQPLIA